VQNVPPKPTHRAAKILNLIWLDFYRAAWYADTF